MLRDLFNGTHTGTRLRKQGIHPGCTVLLNKHSATGFRMPSAWRVALLGLPTNSVNYTSPFLCISTSPLGLEDFYLL